VSLILKNNSIMLDLKSYQGIYEQDSPDELISKLYLLIYLEILPIIEQEYRSNVDDDIWNKKAYIDFMKTLAETISKKIDDKIEALSE